MRWFWVIFCVNIDRRPSNLCWLLEDRVKKSPNSFRLKLAGQKHAILNLPVSKRNLINYYFITNSQFHICRQYSWLIWCSFFTFERAMLDSFLTDPAFKRFFWTKGYNSLCFPSLLSRWIKGRKQVYKSESGEKTLWHSTNAPCILLYTAAIL